MRFPRRASAEQPAAFRDRHSDSPSAPAMFRRSMGHLLSATRSTGGDGSAVQTLSGGIAIGGLEHVFENTGTYTVSVISIDKDGGRSAAATMSVNVVQTLLAGGVLYVGGSSGVDNLTVNAGPTSG